MKGKFLNTKNVVIGLVSLVLIGASATGVTVFLKNRGEAAAAQEENQVQNLPTTGNDNQVNQGQNNSGNVIENPTNPETPVTPVNPTTPGTTTPGSTTTRPSTGTTTPSREEISQEIEETVRIERQKVFEDLQLSWTTIGIPAITANMGIYKPELQIEKTATAVLKAGESEQIPVIENNKPMVRAGDTVIYTIRVLNLGNYKATNVVVTDSLDVIFDGKTVPANKELVKIETLEAGKAATLKVGYVVKQEDINAVLETEQNETISKDIINIATATDGKTTVEDEDDMPVNPDVTINVNKNWQDNDNQDGKRAEKITVELYRNDENEPVATATIDASTDWKYVFSKLPKYDENKNEITYKVVEGTVPEYDTEYEITDNEVEIYNHHTPATTEVSGSKTWDDASNQDGKRPSSITVRLFADGREVTSKAVTANDNWSWSFENLDKYKDGTEIVYTISEDTVADYTTVVDGYNITNTHTPEKISITGSKTWDDASNQDGKRPSSITVRLLAGGKEVASKTVTANDNWSWSFENLDKYKDGTEIVYTISEDTVADYTTVVDGYNITNTHTPEKISISGSKTWNDNGDQDGKRPSSITVRLFADGREVTSKAVTANDNWSWSFTDLDKYNSGTEIVYTISEDAVTDYITVVNGYNVTNTHIPEKISITGSKTWDDASNQDGKRPSSITVRLLAGGKEVASKTVTANDNWSWSFENLDKYKDGTEIVYTISEDTVADYTTVVDGYNITNTHTPEKISISGSKTWNDNGDQDGKRPSSITVRLFADGREVTSKAVTANDNWSWSFTDLDKYNSGTEIVYTISEDAVTDYITVVNGYNVTNTHIPEKISITGSKTWDDASNQDGKRPSSITVRLLAGGKEVASKTVTANDNWSWSFENLDKYKDGTEIVYTISEDTVADYTTVVDGYNITNTHTPEKISITGSKTWDDASNQDGKRPSSITVRLLAGGKEVASKTVTANDNWSWSFENLDKYKDGTEIVYTISEDTVADYTTVVDGYNITNTHTPEKISILGSKTWVDLSDSTRPESITVRLFADGTEVTSKTVTASDNWSWSFTNLDKYKAGTEIIYTVSEETVAGYTTVVDGYNITNTIKQEYVTLRGTKTWIEPTEAEHPTITLGIKQNGSNELYTVNGNPYTFTLENNETEYVFNSLPKYKTEIVDGKEKLVVENGKVVLNTYEVVEVTELTDYTVEYSGVNKDGYNFVQNITNRLNQTTINLTINKVWHDNITASERPEITIILNKNGVFYGSKKISNNETSCKFENLERYTFNNDGTCSENKYTITEEKVNGYDVDTSSEIAKNGNEWTKTIINTKTQEKINIEGTKTWNCVPDGETKPTVIVELFRDYKDGDQAIARTEVVNGKYSFTTDLDKFDMENNYREYQYTVREIVPDGYIATYDGHNITNTKQITATKTAETSTGVKEVNIGETIEYKIIITNNTEVATEVTVKDNILELNHQDNNSVEVELDTEKSITLEGEPLTAEEIQALYNGTFKVQMPATATRTIVIPIKVTAGMTGDKIKNTAYVNGKPTNEVINPIERTVAVTKYKNNLASTNIVLVLDVSSSMKGNKIKTAKQAIVDFINATYKIPENKDVTFTLITFADREYTEGARGDQHGEKYQYHGGLFEFNNEGKYEHKCGNFIITSGNYKKFETAFDGLLTDRGTNMRAGLEVANKIIYGESENAISKLYPNYDKVVIFFGDGEPYGEANKDNNERGIKEAAGWLKAKKAKVYSIGFGNGASKGTKGYERLKDISSDGKVYTSSNYTQLIKNFSDIISADPVVYPYTIDGNAVVELTAESTQKIVVDEKNPIIIKIGDAPEIKITDAATAEAYKITYTDKKIIWDVKEYSKDTNLRISYHVQ